MDVSANTTSRVELVKASRNGIMGSLTEAARDHDAHVDMSRL